jgi:molecular chaperone GrpE
MDEGNTQPKADLNIEEELLMQEVMELKQRNSSLENENLKLQDQFAELNNKHLLSLAEMDNTRKFTIKQQTATLLKYKSEFIGHFLPFLDSLESALKSGEIILKQNPDPSVRTYIEGINKLHQNFMGIFTSIGIKQIRDENKLFDYRLHEVVATIIQNDVPENTILSVASPGYILNGDVIRPAKVVTSKQG